MGKEKFIRKRKSADKFTFKQSIMLGVVIIASVSIIFMQADNASAAKKKTKQDNHYVTMSFKNGVLTVKGNGEMGDPINITVYEGKNIKKVVIKKGVVSLPDNAFKDCKKLKKNSITINFKTDWCSCVFKYHGIKKLKSAQWYKNNKRIYI